MVIRKTSELVRPLDSHSGTEKRMMVDLGKVGRRIGPRIGLTIAGFDPSSGAGITADLKVFEAHGIYGVAAITALTVQSTQGVRRSEAVDPELLRETLDCLRKDVAIAGVKIGMLATEGNVRGVADWLAGGDSFSPDHIVLDPVLNASSGAPLLDRPEAIRSELLGRIGWITPNWAELAVLSGIEVRAREDLPTAAGRLQEIARASGNSRLNVIVTGGDQPQSSDDFLLTSAGEQFWLRGQRVETTSTHGTGCAFSTALLCALMEGMDPFAASTAAKNYVTRALQTAYPIGKGRGPLNLSVRLADGR